MNNQKEFFKPVFTYLYQASEMVPWIMQATSIPDSDT